MHLILDTNLWISFLISSKYEKIDELLFNQDCKLLFSQELLEEFLAVAERPKLKKYISGEDLAYLLETINEVAEFVQVTSEITECRDPKDNFLLSLAVDGKADYLLTGDKDLLILEAIGNTRIITIADFFDEIGV